MHNVSVVYFSMTGHSKKLAKAVSKEFGVEPIDLKKETNIPKSKLLFFASGIYGGASFPEAVSKIEQLPLDIATGVVLLTSSTSKNKNQEEVRKAFEIKGIPILDEFHCYGGFLFLKMTHPNKQEIQDAVTFSKAISGKYGLH